MATTYGHQIVTSGLIMNLDAANPKSYPGSGTAWTDLSGNGNNGSIGSGEFVSGTNGGYLRNAGDISNSFYVSVPHSTSLNSAFTVTTGGWTIQELVWTNSTTYPETDAGTVISTKGYGTGETGFDWNHGMTTSQFRVELAGNSGGLDNVTISVPEAYRSLNDWVERTILFNRDTNKVTLYINGTFISDLSAANTAGQVIYDGAGAVFGNLYGWRHYGRRSYIRIYNKVLSLSEITQNYRALKGRFGL